jgi:hypothetical protein
MTGGIVHWRTMNTTLKVCLAAAACLGVALVALPQATDDPLDSLKACAATQRLILENQFVRVIDDQIPVGVVEPMHKHRHGVTIYLGDYTNEQTTQDGKKALQERKFGTANWSEPVVHTVKNVGKTPSHAIRIELKY